MSSTRRRTAGEGEIMERGLQQRKHRRGSASLPPIEQEEGASERQPRSTEPGERESGYRESSDGTRGGHDRTQRTVDRTQVHRGSNAEAPHFEHRDLSSEHE